MGSQGFEYWGFGSNNLNARPLTPPLPPLTPKTHRAFKGSPLASDSGPAPPPKPPPQPHFSKAAGGPGARTRDEADRRWGVLGFSWGKPRAVCVFFFGGRGEAVFFWGWLVYANIFLGEKTGGFVVLSELGCGFASNLTILRVPLVLLCDFCESVPFSARRDTKKKAIPFGSPLIHTHS